MEHQRNVDGPVDGDSAVEDEISQQHDGQVTSAQQRQIIVAQ